MSMFSSLFSTSPPVDPTAPTFHPVTDKFNQGQLFGELEAKDNEWLAQTSGFVTETQIFYHFLDDGSVLMCQVVHASTGVWYPAIQFTFKLSNPKTGEKIWKSTNISNFVTPPPGLTKHSVKSDQFSITHKPASASSEESYALTAKLDDEIQVSLNITRPAAIPGFKLGAGPHGGYSLFGHDGTLEPAKAEGYVIHRFWPRTFASGMVVHKGAARSIDARPGMFVHAIQGMRPNLVATRWEFNHFQSEKGDAAIMMEFTTTAAHGPKGAGSGGVRVNVGGLVIDNKLVAVTGETHVPGATPEAGALIQSRVEHLNPILDPDTTYPAPTGLIYTWSAPSLVGTTGAPVKATIQIDVGGPAVANAKGLIEKVDVLAEIPVIVKKVISYAAGTKPYIYQWVNDATLTVTGPEDVVPNGSAQISGIAFNEATFVSG